ncbi:sensor domain-containing diguanylate cyclase [Pectobacterium cacticida]|uniref:sensor domain-containing diguanylate cyclase n=1 Tax=Pectobacterium cacticida TaxID=69221 RepID=UPI002FF360C2
MHTGFTNNSRWLDKTRATVVLGILLVAAFLAISWTSYQVAKESLEDEIAENTLPLTSDNVYSEIQQDLLKPIFISSLMAHDTFLRDWVLDNERDPQAMFRYLKEIDRRFNTVFSFFISDKTGFYYDQLRILKTISPDSPDDQWYFQHKALANSTPYIVDLRVDPEVRSRLDIFINHIVRDYDDNFIGMTGVGIPVERVKHLIEKYEKRYNRTIYFVDKEGNITLHGEGYRRPLHIQQQQGLKRIATMILTSPGGAYEYQSNGEPIFLNTRLIPEFGWYLMVEQTSHPSEKRLFTTLLNNLGISSLVSVLFLLLLWLTIGGYQRRLEHMATTDKLTGLMNRQAFDYLFRRVSMKKALQDKTLSLILMDIDHFKAINDQYGHNVGDNVLKTVSAVLPAQTRSSDYSCRWGGEEFVILLDNCDINAAHQRAEALRHCIEVTSLPFHEKAIQITVSCGIAEYRAGETLNTLINRADIALYQAKQRGRNQVAVAEK